MSAIVVILLSYATSAVTWLMDPRVTVDLTRIPLQVFLHRQVVFIDDLYGSFNVVAALSPEMSPNSLISWTGI